MNYRISNWLPCLVQFGHISVDRMFNLFSSAIEAFSSLLFQNAEKKFIFLNMFRRSAKYLMVCFDRYQMKADGLSPPNYTAAGEIILPAHSAVSHGVSFTLYSVLCNMVSLWRTHDK